MSAILELSETGLSEALLMVEGIEKAPKGELMEGIARLVQEQTRHRIEVEKTTPEGEAWKENWKGSSILYESGALTHSIDYVAGEEMAEVGSGLVYARVHQEGGTIRPKSARALFFHMGNHLVQVQSVTIPARRYLGLSADNQSEIVKAAEDFVGRLVQ